MLYSVPFCSIFALSRFDDGVHLQAQKVTQHISSTVAEIQKDIKEHRSRGGDGHGGIVFNEAEVRVLCGCFLIYDEAF